MPPGWHLRTAKPIRLIGQDSKPEPDRCIVRGEIRDYVRDPGPGDIALIAEIADSSLADDRKLATEVYGPAGYPGLLDRQRGQPPGRGLFPPRAGGLWGP